MLKPITRKAETLLVEILESLEELLGADILYINGPLSDDILPFARENVEALKKDNLHEKICVMLNTNGGDVIAVERLVNIFRYNYDEVNYIIPDHAYSAGTILCMSGDNIYMDYNSVLGPIDPQVLNKDNNFVPALGYLKKIEELLKKAEDGRISEAEFLILKDFDLAELSLYEQAQTLTIDLLKKWLVKYKFKNWNYHSSTKKEVTDEEKSERAKHIAEELSNYERWKSHGRPLNLETLSELNLKIEDFGNDEKLQSLILEFHAVCEELMEMQGISGFIFSRRV